MNATKNSAIVIGAHFDDCECGSAACVSLRLVKMGWRVVFLNTIGNLSTWSFIQNKEMETKLIKESHEAAKILGAEKIFLPFQHNKLHPSDANVVSGIAEVIRDVNPTIAFIPWPKDNHYDHARTAQASFEAISYVNRFAKGPAVQLKLKEILAYEISSWQTRDFSPDFFIKVDDEFDFAIKSMQAFESLTPGTLELYAKEKSLRCQHWGAGVRCRYAEGLKHLGPKFPVASMLPELFGEDLQPTGSLQYPWGAKFFD